MKPLTDLCGLSRSTVALVLVATWSIAENCRSSDWPMFRGDARRSGYTQNSLPDKLELRWVRHARHAPRPAWPRDGRLGFDWVDHPIAVEGLVIFGRSTDGKVYALDAESGAQRWEFATDGPVRFAPAYWRGKIYVGSDDGRLYCLKVSNGKLLWQFRGGPSNSRVLGNERLVSRWPVRGGPVIADGVVYFATGFWPSDGIYVYAVDAESQRVLWCNDWAGSTMTPQAHSYAHARSGISPQGYLTVAQTRLLVANGRAVPAAFDRETGELDYYHLQRNTHRGGWLVASDREYFYNSDCIFDATTGRLLHLEGAGEAHNIVAAPDAIWIARGNEITGVPRRQMWVEREVSIRANMKASRRFLAAPTWKVELKRGAARAMIGAGRSLIVGGEGHINVIDRETKETRLDAPVDGIAWGLASADGRLVVTTSQGMVYCFAVPKNSGARVHKPAPVSPSSATDEYAEAARQILRAAKVSKGYCLDYLCHDGSLALELARHSELYVVAVETDAQRVAAARRKLDEAGLLGVRAAVFQVSSEQTLLPDAFADLVVSGRSVVNGPAATSSEPRELRPYGGVLCLGRPGAMRTTIRGGVPGVGWWTHQYADAGNSNSSGDRTIRGPLGIRWFADLGLTMPNRHGRGPAPLVYRGRMYLLGLDDLTCVNAYNGVRIWRQPLPNVNLRFQSEGRIGLSVGGQGFCVGEEGVFVLHQGRCLRFERETGEKLADWGAPQTAGEVSSSWVYLAYKQGTIIGTIPDPDHKTSYLPSEVSISLSSVSLFARDAKTGNLLWRYDAEDSLPINGIAVSDERVYLVDGDLSRAAYNHRRHRRGEAPDNQGVSRLIALELRSGERVWRVSKQVQGEVLLLSPDQQRLLLYPLNSSKQPIESVTAFRVTDGQALWRQPTGFTSRPVINNDVLYGQPGAWRLSDGQRLPFGFRRSYGCGAPSGSAHLLLFRSGTLGYIDLSCGDSTENFGGPRPGCWINAVAAGGLVMYPDATDMCRCSYSMKASVAMQQYGLRPPSIEPAGGEFTDELTVTLTADRPDVDIRYTLDGSPPRESSTHYDQPIRLAQSADLRVRTFLIGLPPSPVEPATFVIAPNLIPVKAKEWSVYNAPGCEGQWRVENALVRQTAPIFYKSKSWWNSDATLDRPGTLRFFDPSRGWGDGELELEASVTTSDFAGIVFRAQGPDQYYIWSMRSFIYEKYAHFAGHVLACKQADKYRVLAQNKRGHELARWHKIRIVLHGPRLSVFFDGDKEFDVTDATFAKGAMGLYSWGSVGAQFRRIRWTPVVAR